MKKILSGILLMMLVFCTISCMSAGVTAMTEDSCEENFPSAEPSPLYDGELTRLTPSLSLETPIAFRFQRIRTDGYISGAQYPKTAVIKSTRELEEYYISTSGSYNMDSFRKATASYNDEWFMSHVMVIVVIEESSGSVGHEVASVSKAGSLLEINIMRKVPEAGTCDMAEWHILIELASSDYNNETPRVTLTVQK